MTDIVSKGLIYPRAGSERVSVEKHTYGELPFDLYRPEGAGNRPAVVFVFGIPDPGAIAFFGAPFKDWQSYVDWARLVAASGLVAVLAQNREPGDVTALFAHLRAHQDALGLDGRYVVFAASGHGPQGLWTIAHEPVAGAVLLYPYTLDVAAEAQAMHFAAPPVTVAELPQVALLVAKAGRDATPNLNAKLDAFVAAARARGVPVTLVEHAGGPHAFDIVDDSPRSHEVIAEILAFLRGLR
jgi:dienelactone hydrolase